MIYFIRCGKDGPIKIGLTDGDVAVRIAYMQVGCPWLLECTGTLAGDAVVEAAMHEKFSHLYMRGEWFYLGADLLSFIDASCNPPMRPKVEPVELVAWDGVEHWPTIVQRIMDAKGWNQTRLALQIGIKQAVVSRWMTGRNSPTGATRTLLRGMVAALEAELSV